MWRNQRDLRVANTVRIHLATGIAPHDGRNGKIVRCVGKQDFE
jgi:hypothetical protein